MACTARVQFGAGNIGRGFLAQLFHESGLEVLFVDVATKVIDAINSRGAYTINVVGDGARHVPIDHIRGLYSTDLDAVAAEICEAEIICTAVGAYALPLTAPAIAAWPSTAIPIRARSVKCTCFARDLHNAAEVLRGIGPRGCFRDLDREAIIAETGFVQTVVSRMVPQLQTDRDRQIDPLGVRVEAYKRLPVDADAWVGLKPASRLVGLEAVSPFEAYVERKLFTHNCAHAVLGYLGYAAGHEFGYEALHDSP